jgi:hypothetical protein
MMVDLDSGISRFRITRASPKQKRGMPLSIGHEGVKEKLRFCLKTAILAVLIPTACRTQAPPSASPESLLEPSQSESHAQPEKPENEIETGSAIDTDTETMQTETDPWAQLTAELEKKAAADPGTLIGSVKVTQALCCGGAAPPPDQPCSASGPYSGEILVREGKKNSKDKPVTVMKTDGKGVFSDHLPEGTYCLVEASKKDPPTGTAPMYVDAQCLAEQWEACDAVVEHPSGKPVFIPLFRPCFGPCYHGPLPP